VYACKPVLARAGVRERTGSVNMLSSWISVAI